MTGNQKNSDDDQAQITVLLKRWRQGDDNAMEQLMPLIYPHLHDIAKNYMRKERKNHTLSPSALLHEAYARLVSERDRTMHNRLHFFAIASNTMHQVLIQYARSRNTQKRGGNHMQFTDIELDGLAQIPEQLLVDLSVVLNDLERRDPRSAHLLMMRFYGGLTMPEMAEVLGVSLSTIKRDLAYPMSYVEDALSKGGKS